MSALNVQTLAGLIADGLVQAQVANLYDVSESYISQLASSEQFPELVEKARKARAAELGIGTTLDSEYDRVELALLHKLKSSVTFLSKPGEIAAVLSRINAAKRRGGPLHNNAQQPASAAVTLVMPGAIYNKLVLNANSEVVEVDGRVMRTMPSTALDGLVQERRENERTEQPASSRTGALLGILDAAVAAGGAQESAAAAGGS
jgi:transcriptional regulator with XRE-family HTH domain